MPDWDSAQYLKFHEERTQPCRDLAARVAVSSPARVIDLGCGPGNSTEVVAARWPGAALTGLDSSPAMIASARRAHPEWTWAEGGIAEWAEGTGEWDVVFSNAALQWVPDHGRVLPRILEGVAAGGAFAMQLPGNWDGAAHQAMRRVGERFGIAGQVREWFTHDLDFYYDTLTPHARRLDLWATEYLHVLPDVAAIVEWYRGTGLRPFLAVLPDDAARERFCAAHAAELALVFPPRASGSVLFPFRRIFAVAYR